MLVIKSSNKILNKQWRTFKRFLNEKFSPPIVKNERKELDEKPTKISRDIFGATILPQNLSFENSKKLSYNQIRLEDIPIVDENKVAEAMVAEKINNYYDNSNAKKLNVKKDDFEVIVIQTNLIQITKKSLAEVFSSTFPVKNIPGPYIFQNLKKILKYWARETPTIPFFQYVKENVVVAVKNFTPIIKIPEILGREIILISHPEHVFAVFEQDKRYPINSVLDSIQRSRTQNQRSNKNFEIGPHLTKEWINNKNLFTLGREKKTEKYFEAIEEAGEMFVRRIKAIRNNQNEVPDNFLYEINKWSLECLCFIIFDKYFEFIDFENCSSSSSISRLLYLLMTATKNFCELEKGFQLWRFVNTSSLSSLGYVCKSLESFISEFIEKAKQNIIKTHQKKNVENSTNLSFIETLLLEKDVSLDDIISNILDVFLIGMNTMSTALSFLLYHISINSQIQSRIYNEVKELLPEKYDRLENKQLIFLKYIQACLKESLRLKLPIPFLTRVVSQNIALSNYEIQKGTFVLMAVQSEVMKKNNFDKPFQFLPERWLNPYVHHPFVTLPLSQLNAYDFQRHLAETSVLVCATLIMKHFSVKYLHGEIEATNSVISFPNKPLKFVFIDRAD